MKVIVADITSRERTRAVPTVVAVEPSEENGLADRSYVVCHELTTLVRGRLDVEPVGRLSPEDMWRVEVALLVALGAAPLPRAPAA